MPRQRRRSGHRLAALFGAVMTVGLAAAPAQAAVARQNAAAAAHPSVTITSVSPNIATPHAKIVVSGIVTNPTSSPLSGVTVQLWSSSVPLGSRSIMDTYLSEQGPTGLDQQVPSAVWSPVSSLGPHTEQQWSLTLPVSQAGMTQFGVYPLAAQFNSAGLPEATARTFLPFWPGKSQARAVKPLDIAWLWPLVSTPQQAACGSLLSNHLASSLASDGRLGRLLADGRTADALRAHLTWAIDPSLLASAGVMTSRYRVGGQANCTGATRQPASQAARDWLAGVKQVAAKQNFFATPYADVDVTALASRGLDTELLSAFNAGRQSATQILGRAQNTTPPLTSGGQPAWIAWPANGIASYTALHELGYNHVATVVLSSTMMPPSPAVNFTPTALASTADGLGSRLHVLLADDSGPGSLAHILATPPDQVPGMVPAGAVPAAGTSSAAAETARASAFTREQWFLAETAMIAAEKPATSRDVVVTPPRRWNPAPGVAGALLQDTVTAPWLHPVTVAGMVAGPRSGKAHRQLPPQRVRDPRALRGSLLRQVRGLAGLTRLQGGIFVPHQPGYLSKAIDAVESSAWRGGRSRQQKALALLHRVRQYTLDQLQQVKIVDTQRVTLGGKSGSVPVSVSNGLSKTVEVMLRVGKPAGETITVGHYDKLITVGAGQLRTVKIPVRSSTAGSFTLSLRLATPGGRLLPAKATPLTVQATHFGTLALVIIGIALLVFVLTAAARAIRRGGRRAGNNPGGPDGPASAEEADEAGPDAGGAPTEADTVEPDRANGAQPAKEPDDQASAPRRAGRAGRL